MTDLNIQNERQRAERKKRLARRQGQPPTTFEQRVALVKQALRRPYSLDALLAGERDPIPALPPRQAPPMRRELDFNEPADRDAAMAEYRKALWRPVGGRALLEHLSNPLEIAEMREVTMEKARASNALPLAARPAAAAAPGPLAKVPVSTLAKRADAPTAKLPPRFECWEVAPGIWSARRRAA